MELFSRGEGPSLLVSEMGWAGRKEFGVAGKNLLATSKCLFLIPNKFSSLSLSAPQFPAGGY